MMRFFFLSLAASTFPVTAQSGNDYLQQGNDLYGAGRLSEASAAYEACLSADPSLQYCAVNLASVLVDLGGDTSRAEELYRTALAASPADGDAAFNLALLLQDRRTEATTREAADLYRVAVTAEPSRWDAWANMATALSELNERPLSAVHSFERAILLIEEVVEANGEGENPERDAYLSKLYYGYGTVLSELTPLSCNALADTPRSLLMGEKNEETAALCKENAQNAMRTAAILDATNVQAAHMLSAMVANVGGDDGVHRRATPEFVAALFDEFADTFDEKLGALEYRVPGIVGAAAAGARSGEAPFRSALDAGCGTGLAGRFLRPLVSGPLVGVDISKKMLDIAGRCTTVAGCGAEDQVEYDDEEDALYDGLMALDLEVMTLKQTLHAPGVTRALEQNDEGFDLIVAADVHVYFGRLDKLLTNYARLSRSGAVLIFSCERAAEEEAPLGWRLLSSGRFAHTKKYVLEAAVTAGYDPVEYEEIVPRMERGVDVRGHLFHFVLQRDVIAAETTDEL